MPLSMKRLRHDEPLQQAVRDSLRLRQSLTDDSRNRTSQNHVHDDEEEDVLATTDDHPLDRLLKHDQACLQLLKEVEHLRKLRKSKTDSEAVAALPEKERSWKRLQHEVDDQLQSIPNSVDTEIHDILQQQQQQDSHDTASLKGPVPQHDQPPEGVEDVLFCIGGYESFSMPSQSSSSSTFHKTVPVWTTVGIQLNRVVERTWEQWLHQQQQQQTFRQVQPESSSSTDSAGPTLSSWDDWKEWRFPGEDTNTPGWQMILHRLKGETLYDRALPQCHFLYGKKRTNGVTSTVQFTSSNTTTNKKKKKSKWAWLDDAESTVVEVLILTGPSLSVDSRPVQLQWLGDVKQFYASIVKDSSGHYQIDDDLFEIDTVPSHQLKTNESSCLILYGKLPKYQATSSTPKTASTNDSRIALASLSNLQDYETADILHGNSTLRSGQNQYSTATLTASVHAVQGTLCRTANTIAWMAAWNARSRGLVLPQKLWNMYKKKEPVDPIVSVSAYHATIPYVRRIRTSAKGKRSVEAFDARRDNPTTLNKGNKKATKAGRGKPNDGPRFGMIDQPNAQQIQMERLTNPFYFLPFHGQDEEGDGGSGNNMI